MKPTSDLHAYPCPWVGPCHCERESSTCACGHLRMSHAATESGEPAADGSGACAFCFCQAFELEPTVTLHIYNQLEQGTPEWDDARRGIITASVVGQFITPKTIKVAANSDTRSMTYQLVAERITGHTEDRYVSYDMEEGHYIEPIARGLYSEHYAPATEVGFMVRDDWGYQIGYSPDGVVGEDGLIEIKKRLPKLHLATILADEVPLEHMAQCQAGLLISGREWLDFISYCGGMPLYVKRVLPDPRWHNAILAAVTAFEESAATMIARYNTATVGLPMTERRPELDEIRI